MKPTALLIDTQYFYHASKDTLKNQSIDYGMVKDAITSCISSWLLGTEQFVFSNCIAYVVKNPATNAIEDELKDDAFVVKTHHGPPPNVQIALDTVPLMAHNNAIMLGSNDQDLIPLVKYCHAHGVYVFQLVWGDNTSRLTGKCDAIISIKYGSGANEYHATIS